MAKNFPISIKNNMKHLKYCILSYNLYLKYFLVEDDKYLAVVIVDNSKK